MKALSDHPVVPVLSVRRVSKHFTLHLRDGRIVEQGLTDRVLDDPQHPYTQLLVASVVAP